MKLLRPCPLCWRIMQHDRDCFIGWVTLPLLLVAQWLDLWWAWSIARLAMRVWA